MKVLKAIALASIIAIMPFAAKAAEMKMAVTTSFDNSGLAKILLPEIKKDLDLDVQLIVVGTGQAIKLGEAGDVDAILVHAKKAEEKFVADGFGTKRREIMYNDFVLIGPKDDPDGIAKAAKAIDAFKDIAQKKRPFVSRGDDSGTYKKELEIWKLSGLEPKQFDASWYKLTGSGMGATLNTASGMNAYVFCDRASWLNFKNPGDLKLLFAGDPVLFNQYTFIAVNPAKYPGIKFDLAEKLEKWLVSAKAQKMIADYKIEGQSLFWPNAKAE